MRKGVSPLISYLLYVGAGLVVVSIVASVGTSTIDTMRDSAAIEQMRNEFSGLSGIIDNVAASGRGTQMTTNIQLDRGSIEYQNQSLFYEIRTPAQIIATGTRQSFGQVAMTANAGTSLVESTYNGEDCYKLENEYTATCIKNVDEFTSMNVSDVILYLENVDVDTVLEPEIDTVLDANDATAEGQVKTVITEQSQFLGTGQVRVLVKPADSPGYTLIISLRTGADFLEVTVE